MKTCIEFPVFFSIGLLEMEAIVKNGLQCLWHCLKGQGHPTKPHFYRLNNVLQSIKSQSFITIFVKLSS